MEEFRYRNLYYRAKPRSQRSNEDSGSAGNNSGVSNTGGASGGGAGGSGGGTGSVSGASIVDVQKGEGILVDKTTSGNKVIFRISHGKTSDGESTANEENDGFFIKNIEVDDFGHVKKITVKGMSESFDGRYLRKDQPDETEYNITFKDGLTIGEFVEGLLGGGAHIDKDGNGWMGGLHLRDFLEVPELRFNRVDVVSGEIWNSVAFGTIESVDTSTQTVTLKLEEGELSGLHVNDICRGIFHNLTGNETADGIDSAGFDKLAGFSTSYFTPTQIIDNSHFKYSLKPGTTTHPCRAMKFAVYGNFTDTARQSCAYQTRNYLRFLRGVNTWAINQSHVSAQFGDLSGLQIDGQYLTQGSIYLNDVYFGGNILKTGGLQAMLQNGLKGEKGDPGAPGANGVDSYTVGLDKYAQLYKPVTGNVPSDISFSAYAARGAAALSYSSTPGAGKYSLNVKTTAGCAVTQSGNTITFSTFTGIRDGVVVVTVNCEGLQSFDLTFTATKVWDGAAGPAGKDGAAGDTVQQIYKRSATQPSTPAESASPSGWSFTPPTGTAPLWMSKATFTGAGALSGSWSYPIRITGDTGPAGAAGKDGAGGPALCFRGTYDSAKTYYGTSIRADVVKVGSVYYMASQTAGTINNMYPPSNYAADGSKPWIQMSSFEHVATGLLFADEATIANWYFSNSRIESINRNVGLDGTADATTPRIWAGAEYEDRATAPLRIMQDGTLYAYMAKISGEITATEGNIGNFEISGGWLQCNSNESGFIDMRGNNTRVAFGHDLVAGMVGGGVTQTAEITNDNKAEIGGQTVALSLRARGDENNKVKSVALMSDGGIYLKGGWGLIEERAPVDSFPTATSAGSLKYYNTFVLAPTSPKTAVLPTAASIESAFGYFADGRAVVSESFIKIKILISRWATSTARITAGSSDAPIINNSGDVMDYIDMSKGDYLEIGYMNRAWYVLNLNR